MSYFNYHAKVKNLVQSGRLVRFEIVSTYNKISPALVLYFNCARPMPIREYRFAEYFKLFEDMKMINIEIVKGTMLQTNNYIVGDSDTCVLIDASASLNEIKKTIGKRKLLAVLLTHGHWDHYLTLNDVVCEYGVKCYCDKNAFLKMKSTDLDFVGNRKVEMKLKEKDFVFIQDGQKLSFENLVFTVIKTSGHTDCSVSFLSGRDFFSGDTLFEGACGRCDLPTSSEECMKSSLQKILALPKETIVFPGHGKTTTISSERKTFSNLI